MGSVGLAFLFGSVSAASILQTCIVQKTGKDCPGGDGCLNGNKRYDTLPQAWDACGQISGCAFIMSYDDPVAGYEGFYHRRATDPDCQPGNPYCLALYNYSSVCSGDWKLCPPNSTQVASLRNDKQILAENEKLREENEMLRIRLDALRGEPKVGTVANH